VSAVTHTASEGSNPGRLGPPFALPSRRLRPPVRALINELVRKAVVGLNIKPGKAIMLVIAAIVFMLWLVGVIFFKAAKGFIHILLIIAMIAVIVHFVNGG
jgi:Family of unknown function (DUF5670)